MQGSCPPCLFKLTFKTESLYNKRYDIGSSQAGEGMMIRPFTDEPLLTCAHKEGNEHEILWNQNKDPFWR